MSRAAVALAWVLAILGPAGWSVSGAEPAPTAQVERQTMAVLDVGQVLKSQPQFKTQLAELKADTVRAEDAFKRQRDELIELSRQLQNHRPGTAEHAAVQEQMSKRQAELSTAIELQKKEFLRREAQVYQRAYAEILKDVQAYARQHHLAVVMRSENAPANVSDPAEVLRGINRSVIWTDGTLDITPQIIQLVLGREDQAKSSAAAQPAEKEPASKDKPKKNRSGKKGRAKPPEGNEKPKSDSKGPEKTAPAKPKRGPADEAKKPDQAQGKAGKKATVLRIVLRGDYPEGPSAAGLFGDTRASLASIVRRLDQAAEDKTAAAVLLEFDDVDLGPGKVHEVRAAIGRVRQSGKPVYAILAEAETSQYLVAAACDEIVLAPSGSVIVPGVRAETTFFKGLLDKLGLQFDALQMGKYKGAAETFTRAQMSPDLRESIQAMVDDSYEALIATLSKDRKLDPAEVKRLVDQGLFTAEAARKAKLIDRVAYSDEFQETLRQRLRADRLNVTSEAKKRPDAELSGMSGMMKLMEMALGGRPAERTSSDKKIAVIYATGTIMEGESSSSLFGEQVLGSTTLIAAIRGAAEDPKVLAIVLRVDSPGGSAVASDLIWREIRKVKKPVIASMGDVAASGGYYIAMGAGRIFAEPGTTTGSIGVFGGKLVTGGLYDKLGITTEIISRGKNSGSLASTQPFTKDERAAWTSLLQETYRQFVDKAAQGRKLPREKLEALAQGRVYTGRMAAANGLVDKLGTLADAIAEAKKAAGVRSEEKIEIQVLPKPRSIFEQLFQEPSVMSERLAAALPGGRGTLARVALLRRLASQRVLVLMPFEIQWR